MKQNILSKSMLIIFAFILIVMACVPVRITNRNIDSTYVFLKFSPDEAYTGIRKGNINGNILLDNAYLPPKYSRLEGRISRYLIIPHGKHKLAINAEGYKTWEKEIFFTGKYLSLNVQLEKE